MNALENSDRSARIVLLQRASIATQRPLLVAQRALEKPTSGALLRLSRSERRCIFDGCRCTDNRGDERHCPVCRWRHIDACTWRLLTRLHVVPKLMLKPLGLIRGPARSIDRSGQLSHLGIVLFRFEEGVGQPGKERRLLAHTVGTSAWLT